MQKTLHEKWIDNAKGIAILMVIVGHASTSLEGFWSFRFVYGIHLVMFFLLRGYTISKKELSPAFLKKYFCRVMTPYFYTCLAILCMDVFNSGFLKHDYSIRRITQITANDLLRSFFASGGIRNFGEIEIGTKIGAIWFLPAIFFAVIIFQLMIRRTDNDAALGGLSVCIALVGYITAKFIWFPFSVQSALLAVFFLWIGYEIKKYQLLSKVRWYHYLMAQIVLLLGIHLGYCNIAFVRANPVDLFLSIPVGLSGCLLVYLLSRMDKRGKLLSSLGQNSLTILCVHDFALETLWDYFDWILRHMGLSGNAWVWGYIILHVMFACICGFLIKLFKETMAKSAWRSKEIVAAASGHSRDRSVEIACSILIFAIIIGCFSGIDDGFRKVIFSCHMPAFAVYMGCFYGKNRAFSAELRRMAKILLIPYAVFVIGDVLLHYAAWGKDYFRECLSRYLLCMSNSGKILNNVSSIGPIYYIPLLFTVRLFYLLIDRAVKSRTRLHVCVVAVSVCGYLIGKKDIWLPWSFDIACWLLIFIHIGRVFKERGMLTLIRNTGVSYFILSPVWVYMIYAGSIDIEIRNYGDYGVTVLGTLAGTLIVYQLSAYVNGRLPLLRRVLGEFGRQSMLVLMIFALLGQHIIRFAALWFTSGYLPHMAISVLITVIAAITINAMIRGYRNLALKVREYQTEYAETEMRRLDLP